MSAKPESPFGRAVRARQEREATEEAARARRAQQVRNHTDAIPTKRRLKPGRPYKNGSGYRMRKVWCPGCGYISRATIGAVVKARGLPTCACGCEMVGDEAIEQLFEKDQS